MATLNLGRIKPVFRGAYAGGTAYVVDDIVTSGNDTFICILASTGNATSNATYWTKLAAKGTDGTDVGATLTTQGDIVYRDGSGLQRLAKGTASQTLKMNSGATAPEWATVTTPTSDWVKLGTTSCSNVADLHVDLFSADYNTYEVFIHNWYGASSGQGTLVQFNTATDTPQTGSNYRHIFDGYYWNNSDGHGNQKVGDWDDSNIAISNLHDTISGAANATRLTFYRPFSSSTYTSLIATGGGHEGNHIYSRHGQGYYNVTESHTGFTLKSTSGNIYIEDITVYGIK